MEQRLRGRQNTGSDAERNLQEICKETPLRDKTKVSGVQGDLEPV